jgi:hypothetical protein
MADSLMSLATAGLFAAKWSSRIEEEWIAALEGAGRFAATAQRLRDAAELI